MSLISSFSEIFLRMPPDQGLAKQNDHGVSGVKARVTVVLATNANGSDQTTLSSIGRAEKPKPFKGKHGRDAHNIRYFWNKKEWMTTVIFREWITEWD